MLSGSDRPWFYTADRKEGSRKREAPSLPEESEPKRPRINDMDSAEMGRDVPPVFNESCDNIVFTEGEESLRGRVGKSSGKQRRRKHTNQEKAAQAAEEILDRAGYRGELLFGGEGEINFCRVGGLTAGGGSCLTGGMEAKRSRSTHTQSKTGETSKTLSTSHGSSNIQSKTDETAKPLSTSHGSSNIQSKTDETSKTLSTGGLKTSKSSIISQGSSRRLNTISRGISSVQSKTDEMSKTLNSASKTSGQKTVAKKTHNIAKNFLSLPPRPTSPASIPMVPNPWLSHGTSLMDSPLLADGTPVTGTNKKRYKSLNKLRRQQLQMQQPHPNYWVKHDGSFRREVSFTHPESSTYRGGMCPSNLAREHPAGPLLESYATHGCPVDAGRNWTREEIGQAIERGNHPLEESAIKQFHAEALNKEERGLVKIVDWEHIKNLPDHLFPQALKSSPLSAVTHKSRGWRAILDLSWSLQWEKGEIPSVNENTTKTAPRGSVDQIDHALQRIIHAIATAPSGEKVFLAKWDVQDGFWQMVCEKGAEWNFCYVLPQEAGKPIKLVVPTALQMGWLESPGFFGAASETARDVIQSYVQAPIGTLPPHKFEHYTQAHDDYKALPDTSSNDDDLLFNFDVFVDDFIGLACAKSKRQLDHVGRGALHGIHDVFPPADDENKDANSVKKMKKLDGAWALNKDALGFEFDGDERTIILDKTKRDKIVGQLSLWTKKTRKKKRHETTAIPFEEFKTLVHQLRHAATCLPTGKSLLSELNREVCIEGRRFIYVRVGSLLYQELNGWKKLLIAATLHPTPCAELVSGHPDGIRCLFRPGIPGIS